MVRALCSGVWALLWGLDKKEEEGFGCVGLSSITEKRGRKIKACAFQPNPPTHPPTHHALTHRHTRSSSRHGGE